MLKGCETVSTHDYIEAINNYDAIKMDEITSSGVTFNGKEMSFENILSSAKCDSIGGIHLFLDSIESRTNSVVLHTKLENRIYRKHNIPPSPGTIELQYDDEKIRHVWIKLNDSDISQGKYDSAFDSYLTWLEVTHSAIYENMLDVGSCALENDSCFLEYQRLLHLKLDDYTP